jgi:hypothetical protein
MFIKTPPTFTLIIPKHELKLLTNNYTIGGEPMALTDFAQLTQLLQGTSCSWWALPEEVKAEVAAIVPEQDSWTLNTYKEGSYWSFDLPEFLTWQELFCGGTELVLDYFYKVITGGATPKDGSYLKLTVSSKKMKGATTKCVFLYPDPKSTSSSYYLDTTTGLDVWLCPYLQVLFKGVPDELYLKMETTDEVDPSMCKPFEVVKPPMGKGEVTSKFYGDFFKDKKEPPKDAVPGVYCYFPTLKYYLKVSKLMAWLSNPNTKDSEKENVLSLLKNDKDKATMNSLLNTIGGDS